MKNHWYGNSESRLRWLIAVFFFALAIPALVLIVSSYKQLKWEALHQQQTQANELLGRINDNVRRWIAEEEARAFADYQFLTVSGDPQSNFLQPSVLASDPPATALPGALGYFQVDNQGYLSSPFMPATLQEANRYGVSDSEFAARRERYRQLQTVLSENRLIREHADEEGLSEQMEERVVSADAAQARQVAPPKAENKADAQRAFDALLSKSPKAEIAAEAEQEESDQNKQQAQKKSAAEQDQQRATALASQEARMRRSNEPTINKQRETRREQSYAPQAAAPAPAQSVATDTAVAPSQITVFESEVDPFAMSMLDSGHLVLFRKVWRNEQRLTQGILLDQQEFLREAILEPYRATALSTVANLELSYRGRALANINGGTNDYFSQYPTHELQGESLLQGSLAEPFTDIRLNFYANELPLGSGGQVVAWTSVVMASVLLLGTVAMYRLGIRQIRLARQQQDFVSAVSHELKTPLTSIRMYGEILRAGWADEEKKKQYYDFIFDESERLSRLVNNVLQLARMNRQELHVQVKAVAVSELLANVQSKLQSQVERAGFSLQLDCDERLAQEKVLLDPDCFLQVIINLVDNALKFSRKAPTKKVQVSFSRVGNTLMVSVRDYGPGIGRQHLRKIFDLFYRGENELTRETVGTGIGLALVHQLMRLMEGRVEVVNTEPGAEFRLFLPMVDNGPPHPETP